MQRTTKLMFYFGLTTGVIWSIFWSIQDSKLNLWPLMFMLICPMVLIIVIQTIRKKPW